MLVRYILRYYDGMKFWWDVLVIILAIFNCLSIPVDISFEPAYSTNIYVQILNFFIDFLFFIDIFINFNTSFYDKNGIEIF